MRILFLRKALKYIFATFKICDSKSMIKYISKRQNDFSISQGFYFHINKTLAKIFEFTV